MLALILALACATDRVDTGAALDLCIQAVTAQCECAIAGGAAEDHYDAALIQCIERVLEEGWAQRCTDWDSSPPSLADLQQAVRLASSCEPH